MHEADDILARGLHQRLLECTLLGVVLFMLVYLPNHAVIQHIRGVQHLRQDKGQHCREHLVLRDHGHRRPHFPHNLHNCHQVVQPHPPLQGTFKRLGSLPLDPHAGIRGGHNTQEGLAQVLREEKAIKVLF